MTLTLSAYLGGSLAIAVVVGVLGYGSLCVRRVLLPTWRGAVARLAEVIIGLFVLFAVAQVLGAVHWLSRGPVLLGEVAAGVAMIILSRRWTPAEDARPADAGPSDRPDRRELVAVGAGVALVVVQWSTHVAYALTKGMTYSDTMWYHQPFAARFVQHHSFNALDGVGLEAARLYPLNSPLLHALGMLAYGSDLVSPLFNLGWMLLALLAAWCIGRGHDNGHLCVLAAAVAVGLPILTATQAGQASSDIGTVALFLAAVALLLETDFEPVPVGLAGLALGMAISTKITVAAPAALLGIGVVVLAWRAHKASVAVWVAAVAASGSFWFVRNWWLFSSPLPWFDLHLGPLHFPVHEGAAASASGEPSLVRTLSRGDAPRTFYFDALWVGFGRVWPLVVLLLAVAIAVLVLRGRSPLHRCLGVVLGLGCIAYVVTPFTGGLNFASGLRFLIPLMLVAFVLLPIHLPAHARTRRTAIALLFGLAVVSATMPSFETVPAWPRASRVPAVAVLAVLVGAGVAVGRLGARGRRSLLFGVAALGVVLATGGWFVQRHYFEHRYVAVGLPNDGVDAYFRGVHDERVAVLGTNATYPMFGLDLSNDVRRVDDPPFDLTVNPCATWRSHLEGYGYVAVVEGQVFFEASPVPGPEVFADPAANKVFHDDTATVYRLTGTLDPGTCPVG